MLCYSLQVSGFKLDTIATEGQMTEDIINEMIQDAVKSKVSKAQITQLRKKYSKWDLPPIQYYMNCYLGNDIRKHRIPLENFRSNLQISLSELPLYY